VKGDGWKVQITCPSAKVTSMNSVIIEVQQPLKFSETADVVLFGSGIYMRDIAQDTGSISLSSPTAMSPPLVATCHRNISSAG
jgi:alanine racemase